MPAVLETRCPHCNNSLKLNSRKALGKQAPCPKCKQPFLVREFPSNSIDDFDDAGLSKEPVTRSASVDNEHDANNDDYVLDDNDGKPSGPHRSQPDSDGEKPPNLQKSRHWVKPGLLIGGSILVVTVVGLGSWFIWGLVDKKLDLAYLPPNATSITITRPASHWNARAAHEDYRGIDIDKMLEKMREEWGVTPKDITSVTEASGPNREAIRVVRSSMVFDEKKITGHAQKVETAEFGGKRYYRLGGTALYFPDKHTVISGSEDSVKKAIERGDEVRERERLKFVDAGYDYVAITIHTNSRSSRSPDVTVRSRSAGVDSHDRKTQVKYLSESAAIKAFEKGAADNEDGIKKWKNGGRDRKQRDYKYGRVFNGAPMTASEIADRLKRQEDGMKSVRYSRSGLVVTRIETFFVTDYSKRRKQENSREHPTNIDQIVKKWGDRLFGIPRRARIKPPTRNPVMKYEIRFASFRGQGDQAAAVEKAMKGVQGLDPSKTEFDAAGKKLVVSSQPRKVLILRQAVTNLRRAGFKVSKTRRLSH